MKCVDNLYPAEAKQILVYALYDRSGKTVKEICQKMWIDAREINRWLHNYRRQDIDERLVFSLLYEIEDTEPDRYFKAAKRYEADKKRMEYI